MYVNKNNSLKFRSLATVSHKYMSAKLSLVRVGTRCTHHYTRDFLVSSYVCERRLCVSAKVRTQVFGRLSLCP